MSTLHWQRVALASLVGSMVISVLLVVVPLAAGPSFAGSPATSSVGASHGLPPGTVLAAAKLLVLGLVFARVRNTNVYSLQWSSMFILLLMAEGVVRATSDPRATAGLGVAETIFALAFFVAVLAILRPFKQRARAAARDPSTHGHAGRRVDDRSDEPGATTEP